MSRGVECGNVDGRIWFFKVYIDEKEGKNNFKFEKIDKKNEKIAQYNSYIIDSYTIFDFYPNMEIKSDEDTDLIFPFYDIDKQSADLFIFPPDDMSIALRFEWNGERYVKKIFYKEIFLQR